MSVSLIVRATNYAWIVEETWRKLRRGRRQPDQIIGLDLGSSDGTGEFLAANCDAVLRLELGGEWCSTGAALNRALELATGDIVVYLCADCPPVDDQFLSALVSPIAHGLADATFARQLPRKDAAPIVVKDCERAFGFGERPSLWHRFFSDAACAFRAEVLRRRPFAEDMPDSEDLEWFWSMKDDVRIRFVTSARVYYPMHRYRLRETWAQFRCEGQADLKIFAGRIPPGGRLLRALGAAANESLHDWAWALRRRHWRAMLQSVPVRLTQRLAYWRGIQTAKPKQPKKRFQLRRRRFPQTDTHTN